MLKNKLTSVEKELQQAKKDNTALAHYINARRKEETQRKEEAWRKVMVMVPTSDESQSFKDAQT
jgi:hypothetical protein